MLKRISHEFVLACTFGAVAVGLCAATVENTAAALREADATIAYASTELAGLRYLSDTLFVARELVDLQVRVFWARHAADGGGLPAARAAAISVAIDRVGDPEKRYPALDSAVVGPLATMRGRWQSAASRGRVSLDDIAAEIDTVQPLFSAVFNACGLVNDPSTDGINFGDALLHFPVMLADTSRAAALAGSQPQLHGGGLHGRFAVARLLAQAQAAAEVGLQDTQDEVWVNAGETATAIGAADNVLAFKVLQRSLTDRYVERAAPLTPTLEPVPAADFEAFARTSFETLDTLRDDLLRVTNDRIAEAQRLRDRRLLWTIGGIALEVATMFALGWFSITSYQNGRRRAAAERNALEAHRESLQAQLTHANAERALLRAKAEFRAVFDRAPTGMVIVDRSCKMLDTNEAAQAMFGTSGCADADTVIADHAAVVEQIFAGDVLRYSEEREYRDRAHRPCWLDVSISPVHDEAGTALFAVLMIRDVTENKSMEAQLVFEAEHDALTGLPNRKLFLAVLQQALDERRRNDGAGFFSVVFIDFNDFKTINDSFGHQAGDRFLIDGAARLRSGVRSTDVVARIGGDEFAVMLRGLDRSDIERSVTRLQAIVSEPISIEGQLVTSSASFGIAQAEANYTVAAEIIRDADTAMYAAKSQGGRRYVFFDVGMREAVVRRMQLSIEIVHALRHGEMELRYQPIVDLRDGRIAGCEALLRWRRPDGSLILPSEFMPLAEENGSIIDIGHWVTATACAQMHAWNELAQHGALAGLSDDFVMHINLAVPEVHHVDLLANLRETFKGTNVARKQIILEITEGIVLKNTQRTRDTLDGLTGEGFRLCIDDFGTGYSSLRYLNELPLHSFKIDRSFVSNGGDGLANESIVEMLMVLSRSLGLSVVAEGIETHGQWEALRDRGCAYGQGYFFAPALEGGTFTTLLERDANLAGGEPRLQPAASAVSA